MSDNDAEVNYINSEHLQASSKVLSTHPAQSTYDKHDHSDKYYLNTENIKNREYQKIEQFIDDSLNFQNKITSCIETGEYEPDESGYYPIRKGVHQIMDFIESSSSYVLLHEDGKVQADSRLLIDKFQTKIDKQVNFFADILSNVPMSMGDIGLLYHEGQTENGQSIKDCVDMYGSKVKMWLDMYSFYNNFDKRHKIIDQIKSEVIIKALDEKSSLKPVIELKKCLSAVGMFVTSENEFNPKIALDLIDQISTTSTQVEGYSNEIAQLAVHKKSILSRLSVIFEKTNSFDGLDNNNLHTLLENCPELTLSFVKNISDTKFNDFLHFNQQRYFPVFLGNSIFQDGVESNKQQLAINFIMEQIPKITAKDSTEQRNRNLYSMCIEAADYLKNTDINNFKDFNDQLLNVLPTNGIFYTNHKEQIVLYREFLHVMYMGIVDVGQVNHATLQAFTNNFVGTHKYEEANQSSLLMKAIQQKFSLPTSS